MNWKFPLLLGNKKNTWLAMGDSITYGFELANLTERYTNVANNILRRKLINKGRSGASMAVRNMEKHDPYCFSIYTKKINFARYDLLTIAYGVNDFGVVPIGNIDSLDPTTFYGAMNIGLKNIYDSNSGIKIIFITPIYMADAELKTNRDGLKLLDYCEAIKAFCKQNNLLLMDAYNESGINRSNHRSFLPDGLHPNAEGHKLIGEYVGEQVSKIYSE